MYSVSLVAQNQVNLGAQNDSARIFLFILKATVHFLIQCEDVKEIIYQDEISFQQTW